MLRWIYLIARFTFVPNLSDLSISMRLQRLTVRTTKRIALGLAAFAGSVLLIRAALARPHPPAPAKSPAAVSKTDCGCGAAPKGRRIRLLKIDANGSPSIGPDNTYDVIIPDSARWQAVHVQAGAEEWFGTNIPLPSGPNPTDGGWDAVYGRISRDGTHYQAPFDVPPGHLDIVSYMMPSAGGTVIQAQFLVYVDGAVSTAVQTDDGNTPLALNAQDATNATQTDGTTSPAQAQTGLPAQEATDADADATDVSVDLDSNCNTPTTVNVVANLLEAAPAQISPLPDSDFWPALATAAPAAAQAQAGSVTREAGYPIPSWSSNEGLDENGKPKSLVIGIRQKNPVTNQNRNTSVVTCRQKGPFNDPPPFPIDPVTKKPVLQYSCVPGVKYDMPNDAQPHWQCGTMLIGGWKTFAKLTVNLSADQTLDIKSIYNVQLKSGVDMTMDVKYRDTRQSCTRYVDHYTCGDNGKSWVYTGSELFEKEGTGEIFLPAWMAYYEGYPPNGQVVFSNEYSRGPVHSPN